MTFALPHLLWLLLAPAALFAWEVTRRHRAAADPHPKILRAEAGASALKLSPSKSELSTSTRAPRVWLCLGLALAAVALARPQWGRTEEPVFDQSREIIIAMDLSRSMLTPDVKPSRLERAKLLTQSLLEKLAGERVGLIVFSGTAFLQSPLSSDYEILREFLPVLGPDYLPEGGTNYGALIDTALTAFGSTAAADRFLIVLSDGEATDSDWKSHLGDLKKKGIRVLGLGVGTDAGAMIPDGAGNFVKDDRGAVVLSKLESATLRELAGATDGAYRDASSWLDLATLLQATVEAGQKGKFVEKNTVRLVERFQWPLAFALWCLLVSFYYEFPVRPRPRAIALRAADPGLRKPEAGKLAAAVALLALLSAIRYPAAALAAEPPPGPTPHARIVGRLAATESRTGRDWAELARESVTWGTQLQSQQQPVPEGPVRDALAAVGLGEKLDAKTADWPKLREELEALLKKPDDQKQPQDKKSDQDQKPDDQKKDQQQQNSPNQKDAKNDPQHQQGSGQPQKPDDSKSDQGQPKPEEPKDKKDQPSAFGDMKDRDKQPPPPEPSGETQKVGGTPEKKETDKDAADPNLAVPLQKLDQLKNQDSPAKLFQLMEGERKPDPKKKGKDW